MKFSVTGMDEETGQIADNGDIVNAKGGTEMMKEGLLDRLDPALADQFNIICSRVREIDPDKKNILWLHDLFADPEAQHLKKAVSRSRFEKLVFVSNYQFQTYFRYLGVPFSESIILKNAIVPIEEHTKPASRDKPGFLASVPKGNIEEAKEAPIRIIYHTTPHRGLELLVPVFEHIYDNFHKNIQLDVYSSFNIYGWPQRDEPFKELFAKCEAHPAINYHGAVPNDEVREALKSAHIFAYPSIWEETSCIALMEAMSAGCACIVPNLGALPETAANFGIQYQWDENPNRHANAFGMLLESVIRNYWDEAHQRKLAFQKIYADNFYSWDSRIIEWNGLLQSLAD